mgnify:FL=1
MNFAGPLTFKPLEIVTELVVKEVFPEKVFVPEELIPPAMFKIEPGAVSKVPESSFSPFRETLPEKVEFPVKVFSFEKVVGQENITLLVNSIWVS